MSYQSWIRNHQKNIFAEMESRVRSFLGLAPAREERKPPETPWPEGRFERFCIKHDRQLLWGLCSGGGHHCTEWLVKDMNDGRAIYRAKEEDGTQTFQGYAPRR